jgi:serine/threonine protein phosphatase PrpC
VRDHLSPKGTRTGIGRDFFPSFVEVIAYHPLKMADPQVLYLVTAVVVVALVAWVIAVLARRPDAATPQPMAKASVGGLAPAAAAPHAAPAARTGVSERNLPTMPPAARIQPAAGATVPAGPPQVPVEDDVDVSIEGDMDDDPTGPQALILVNAVGRTDPGLKRKHNEDAYTILEDHHVFVIADGMGRHAAGEVASQLAVDAVAEAFRTGNFDPIKPEPMLSRRANELRAAILLANARIFQQANAVDEYHGMGTTVVSAYFSPNKQRVYIAHVGDSRCYRVRDAKLKQLTRDHTLGAVGIQGKSSNVLSRAVGVEEFVEVDVTMESPLPGDIYLLCSDGLSRMATDDEILETITSAGGDLELANKHLIDLANSRGGRDNITTILVRVQTPKLF